MKTGKRIFVALTLVFSILAMAGCQAVGGVDVNQALLSSIDQNSYEGNFDFEWEFVRDPSQKQDEETSRILSALGSGKLSFTELKQEKPGVASGGGLLTIPKGTIPIKLYLNGSRYIADVDGAKKPYMFDLLDLNGADGSIAALEQAGVLDALMDPANEKNRALSKAILSFVLKNTPNPKQISATPVSEQINGKQTALTKVSLEVGADELAELIMELLRNVAKDEQGLKELLGKLYDAMKPMLEQMAKEEGGTDPVLRMALNNKTLAVEFVYETIKPMLESMAADLEKSGSEASSEIAAFFGDDTKLQMDVLLSGITPVGYDLDVVISPKTKDNGGISAIRIGASERKWNIGGSVKAEAYNGEVYEMKSNVKPRHRLDNVKEDSLLYAILKNDLKVTTHSFTMATGKNGGVTDGLTPYVKGAGTTMVPVRYVSEQLDTVVTWNGKTSTVTIRDEAENMTVVLTVGSKKATVNGKPFTLPEAPERKFATTFVPFAFIVKALGGTSQWDPAGFVTITKEF